MRIRVTMALMIAVIGANAADARSWRSHHAQQVATDPDLGQLDWSLSPPAPSNASRRWLIGDAVDGYDAQGPDAIHFDAGAARFKLRGAGVKMKMPIG